jgi:hypothetical protein
MTQMTHGLQGMCRGLWSFVCVRTLKKGFAVTQVMYGLHGAHRLRSVCVHRLPGHCLDDDPHFYKVVDEPPRS